MVRFLFNRKERGAKPQRAAEKNLCGPLRLSPRSLRLNLPMANSQLEKLCWLAALAAFTFCLRALLRARRACAPNERAQDSSIINTHADTPTTSALPTNLLPDWALALIGYACFIWTALAMNRVARISPDLLVSV